MTPVLDRRGVIPPAAWIVAAAIPFACFAFLGVLVRHGDLRYFMVPAMGLSLVLAPYVLLVGYVHRDAKRRGMRYVMWTWLAILVPNAIGIVLYFILRDPMPVYCSSCGSTVKPGFAFCPRCGTGMAPSCRQCNRVAQGGWTHCAYCGTKL